MHKGRTLKFTLYLIFPFRHPPPKNSGGPPSFYLTSRDYSQTKDTPNDYSQKQFSFSIQYIFKTFNKQTNTHTRVYKHVNLPSDHQLSYPISFFSDSTYFSNRKSTDASFTSVLVKEIKSELDAFESTGNDSIPPNQ
ncbi:hypothetical protein HanIR_Chr17g0887691 [Helianthus annuus]|nr:hypothetical protein HanIR_Chr17g0887691 [Helianthus annuus]